MFEAMNDDHRYMRPEEILALLVKQFATAHLDRIGKMQPELVLTPDFQWNTDLRTVIREWKRWDAAATVLDARAEALGGSPDRVAVRDIPEQVTALQDDAASCVSGADEEPARMLLGLRLRALDHLN
jgi:hypothetical protein